MSLEQVITEVDQLTPAYLTALLRRKGCLDAGAVSHVHVSNKTVSPVSLRHTLSLTYTPDTVGKALPHKIFLRLANPEFIHNSDESTIFYNRLVPMMRERWQGAWPFAECIDAIWSPTLQLDHLLMEDLADTHFTVDNNLPPTHQASEELIDTSAHFHAFWWEHRLLGKKIGSLLTNAIIDGFAAEFKTQLTYLAEIYQSDLSDEQFALVQRAMIAWPKLRRARVVQGQGVTLVHRDPHPGNILYPRNPTTHSIKLIDWQSWRIDPGTDDLAYLIAFHWPAQKRVEREEPLLRRYHQQLVDLGVKAYTWDDCVYDYRASILRFITVMGLHWRHPPNRARLQLGLQAFIDWQCGEILP
jgi:hypothetical protein